MYGLSAVQIQSVAVVVHHLLCALHPPLLLLLLMLNLQVNCTLFLLVIATDFALVISETGKCKVYVLRPQP